MHDKRHHVTSLTQTSLESRPATDKDAQWWDKQLDAEERTPGKRRRWFGLDTGTATDGDWLSQSRPTAAQKEQFNAYAGDEVPERSQWFAIAMFALAVVSLVCTTLVTIQVQGGWFIDWTPAMIGGGIGLFLLVFGTSWWILTPAKNQRQGLRSRPWAGALFVSVCVLIAVVCAGMFFGQLFGGSNG